MFRVLRPGLLLVPCLGVLAGIAPSIESQRVSTNSTASSESEAVLGSASLKTGLNPANLLREAMSCYRRGKLDAAIEKYEIMLRVNPVSPEAHAGLTRIYLKQGKVNLASETVRKGLAFSNSPDLRVALGEVYFREGKIPEAEEEWLKVADSDASGRAHLGLARVRNALSSYEEGKEMIDKAREINAIDPDIELNWNITLPLSERIRRLESYLASADSIGAGDREESQQYLDYLKMLDQTQGGCHLVNQTATAEMPLARLLADAEHLRGYGLAVRLNGRKATLMLDTGAGGILVSRKVAEKAGIIRVAESRIDGVGDRGAGSGFVGLAGAVRIGDLEFRDCPVRVLDKKSVLEEEGLIGSDFFEQFLVNIDFPNEKLRLSELPRKPDHDTQATAIANFEPSDGHIAEKMQSYMKVYRFGHYLLVPTKVGEVPGKLFLLDTGGVASQITPAAAREITRVRSDSDKVITGISGSVKKVYSAGKTILEFGHLREENQDLVAFDLTSASQSVGTEISGTLGFATLRLLNIKIDYRDGLVAFDSKAGP
jgi:tetratricopeptide (TPR) repeat protein